MSMIQRFGVLGGILSLAWMFSLSAFAAIPTGGAPSATVEHTLPKPIIRGEWVQGAVLIGKIAPVDGIEFMGRELSIDPEGYFVIGLGRDYPTKARLKVSLNGETEMFDYSVRQRSYKIQKIEGVPKQTVNPDPEHLSRIRAEAAAARKARKADTTHQYYRQSFQWPLEGPITGVYGSQRYYNGEPRRPHFGVDVAAPTGTVVVAPVDGVVTLAHDNMFFSGGTLIVDHGHGLSSSFIHLSKILVTEGAIVKQGQPIAEVGATGRVTGPHLDWRMNWYDQRVDPQTLVPQMRRP